jgi:hypothetical protein
VLHRRRAITKYFKVYQAIGTEIKIPTYFIESTAPDNVDDTKEQSLEQLLGPIADLNEVEPIGKKLRQVKSDEAVEEIAKFLASADKPNLVIMVHGFNNAEPEVLKIYEAATTVVNDDKFIAERKGLVCVGYRWPSERMGAPFGSSWSALPTLPTWVLGYGAAALAVALLLFCSLSSIAHIVFLFGWILAGLISMTVLRVIVYFRDNYRATNYGVPDLVQVVRAIEGQLRDRALPGKGKSNDVELSFIGHSMGGLVVTNTIRTLSDAFATPVGALNHYGAAAPKPDPKIQNVGQSFVLKRFVLASPDIPAETLLSDRGNVLAAVLSRFEEAYLFGNEGDEVLRQISTLANYFVFPTKSSDHGFRLGNTEILSCGYGLIPHGEADFLAKLRIGNLTLQQLYAKLEQAEASRHKTEQPTRKKIHLPKVFTYFDCTDYVDLDNDGKERPLLTFALRNKSRDADARLPFHSHMRLLYAYVVAGSPNVHGGYFEGKLSQTLIYRLACLGYAETRESFGGEAALGTACGDKQIRVLLSPCLDKPGHHRGGPAVAKLHDM